MVNELEFLWECSFIGNLVRYLKGLGSRYSGDFSYEFELWSIKEFFVNKNNGKYVDLGAFHPMRLSNTYLLYKKGWNGINIDIHSFSIDLFNYLRPNDINFNMAVSNKNEDIDMYFQKKLSQLSTIEEKQAKKVFQGDIKKTNDVSKFENFLKSLTNVCFLSGKKP